MPNPLPSPPPPVSIYLHLPWCIRKCPYCDFNSHAIRANSDFSAYVDALIADLHFEQPLIGKREISSIFIGGGTPSLFPAEQIARLLEKVAECLNLAEGIEVTLEANPGAVEVGRFAAYRRAGVSRLSIGVQSFNDARLTSLQRVHTASDANHAVDAARAAGFDNINLDLMFGLPGQSLAEASDDVEHALSLSPEHLSYYQLTLEPNTQFAVHPPPLPSEGTVAEIHQRGSERLETAGYRQYEISAFAQPGRNCRHNLNYWSFGDYLGIGAGAHGKISRIDMQHVERRQRVRAPAAYGQHAGRDTVVSVCRVLEEADLRLEFAMNAMRVKGGFALSLFTDRTGLPASAMDDAIAMAERRGLLRQCDGRVVTTELGWRFLDDLLALFV